MALEPARRELPAVQAVRRELATLCAASAALGRVSHAQAEREREIQALCNSVWTVVQQQYSVSGKCGDQQQYTVSHQYTQQIATIDSTKFDSLRKSMASHLEYATSALASGLFEHSLCELRLLMALQTYMFATDQSISCEVIRSLLKTVLGHLHNHEAPLDSRSFPFLRKLALLLGSQYIASVGSSSQSRVIDRDEGNSTGSLTSELLEMFFIGKGCGWAAPLLQPTIHDVVDCRWLWYTLINQPAESGTLPEEADLIAYLSQVNWLQIRVLQAKDVEAFIVQAKPRSNSSKLRFVAIFKSPLPIQRTLRRFCENNQVRSLIFLGKVLSMSACIHPTLSLTALNALTRSTSRATMLCAPLLCLWQWNLLPPDALWSAWCEIYCVNATRIEDFTQRHPLQQQKQQKEFIASQLSNAMATRTTYDLEPVLASTNNLASFPMLFYLRQLALLAAFPSSEEFAPEPRLPGLLARELLALALLGPPEDLAATFRQEASSNLSALCKQIPKLISAVIEELVNQVPQIVIESDGGVRACALLSAMVLDDWQVDLPEIDSLCALLTNGKFTFLGGHSLARTGLSASAAAVLSPATKPTDPPLPVGTVTRKHIELALGAVPVQMDGAAAAEAALRVKLGCVLFEKLDWANLTSTCRERALLMLLACRADVPMLWWWSQLLSSPGVSLVDTSLPPDTFEALMQGAQLPSEVVPGSLAAVQSMLIVAKAQQQVAATGRSSIIEMGMQYSLWQRLGTVMEVGQHNALRQLLEKILGVLMDSPTELPSQLPSLMSSYMALAPSHAEAMRMMMLNSLAQAEDEVHERWLTMWASLLAPLVATDDSAASLFDTLVHAVFASADMIIADSPIIPALLNCQFSKRQVLSFLSGKKVWLGLAAAIAFTPQLPTEGSPDLLFTSTKSLDMKMRSALGTFVGATRKHINLGEDKKTGFLLSSDGGASSAAVADSAWGVTSTQPTSSSTPSAEASTDYCSMGSFGSVGGNSANDRARISREALPNCALGLLFEMATALDRDVRALLYWERFFILYFTANKLEPGFFPSARQEEANDHFGRVARAFEATDRRVYMLYECFTTWSNEIIPRRGGAFVYMFAIPSAIAHIPVVFPLHVMREGTVKLPIQVVQYRLHPVQLSSLRGQSTLTDKSISFLSSTAGPPLLSSGSSSCAGWGQHMALTSVQPLQIAMKPLAEQMAPIEPVRERADGAPALSESSQREQARPSHVLGHIDTQEVLTQLMPKPALLPPVDRVVVELRSEESSLQQRLREMSRVLAERVQRQVDGGGPGAIFDHEKDGIWDDLSSASDKYRNCIHSVRLADSEYLSLVRQLNVNQHSGESKKVMVRHPECEQPVMFVVPQIKVVPGPTHVRERLQTNRATFIALHGAFHELSRTFATHAALLELLGKELKLNISFQKGGAAIQHDFAVASSSSDPYSRERLAAIELFFMLLPLPLGYALPSSISRLCEALMSLVSTLGEMFIKGDPSIQMRLLRAVIQGRSCKAPELLPAPQLQQLQQLRLIESGHDLNKNRDPEFVDQKKKIGDSEAVGARKKVQPAQSSACDMANAHVDTSDRFDVPLINRSLMGKDARIDERKSSEATSSTSEAKKSAENTSSALEAKSKKRISVRLPDTVKPGQSCTAKLPSGKQIMFKAPTNAIPGMMVQVDVDEADSVERRDSNSMNSLPMEPLDSSASADLLARQPLVWLTPIITPNVMLDLDRPADFIQLLNVLAEARAEHLEPTDAGTLCACFDVQRYLDRLPLKSNEGKSRVGDTQSEEMMILALTVEQLLGNPGLASLGSSFIERITRTAFPHNVSFALDIVLSAAAAGSVDDNWHTAFAKLPFDRLQLRDAARLLHALNARLPLPARFIGAAVQFVQWLISSPHMPGELAAELLERDERASDGADSLWNELLRFLGAALSTGGSMPDETFSQLLELLCQTVHNTPQLVDKIWYFFIEMLAPAADAIGTVVAQENLRKQMAALPWHQVQSHLLNEGFLTALLNALPRFRDTVHVIFSKIDWISFLSHLISNAAGNVANTEPPKEPQVAVLLRVVCEVNALSPQSIANNARVAFFGEGPSGAMETQLKELHAQLWSLTEPFSLREMFNGRALLSPLGTGFTTEDPSNRLIENAALLYTACVRTGHPMALATVAEEARSLLFYCLSDAGGNLFWHLPFSSHTALLSGVLVPSALMICRMQPVPHEEMATTLRALLSAADIEVPAPHVLEGGLSFPNTDMQPFPPFPPTEEALEAMAKLRLPVAHQLPVASVSETLRHPRRWFGSRVSHALGAETRTADAHPSSPAPVLLSPAEKSFNELNSKMTSLVVQFCRGATKEVALIVMGLLPTSVRSTAVIARLMEAALQAYLNNASLDIVDNSRIVDLVSEPLSFLGAAIASQPELSLSDVVLQSVSQQTPLTLRLLLELQLATVDTRSSVAWMPVAIECVKQAAACRVPPARKFELLPLWFHVIEIVAADNWLPDYSASVEALETFSKSIQSACGLSTTNILWDSLGLDSESPSQSPSMQLAARAFLLYFNHAVTARLQGQLGRPVAVNFTDSTPELRSQTVALLKLQQQSPFRSGFETFFGPLEQLVNAQIPVTLPHFKRQVVAGSDDL